VGVIALLTHPRSPDALEELRELQSDAKAIGQQLLVRSATSEDDLESAFASMAQHGVRVLLIGQDPFLFQAGGQLVALAAKHRIPAIYGNSELAAAGALISYGARASQTRGGSRATMPDEFSRVLSLQTCRLYSRSSSIWLSTSTLQRHLALRSRRHCSPAPTR
jgi:hypothetical protein